MTALARLAGRARLLPKLLRPVDGPHAGIFDRVEIFAFLDRRRTLFGVIELGLERGRRLQRLQESNHVVDFLVIEQAVSAPGRHHRLRIVNPRVVNVVEEVFILTAGIANFRKIGTDITREIGSAGRAHDMASKARASAVAIGHQLSAFGGVARDRTGELARRASPLAVMTPAQAC